MGDWNLLGSILEEVHIHSTIVGKIWLTILFIFRMLVLGVAAEDVWDDEQNAFVCNTDQPGCKTVCYDRAFPISLVRFWVLQVIFVSAPSLAYMGHALYRIRALEKERRRRKAQLREELVGTEAPLEELRRFERELKRLEESRRVRKAPLRGSLLRTYVIHILTRSVLEVGFILGQYILYGVRLEPLYKCERLPCPNSVDCYISRPTEKTVFMVFMTSIAAVSLFLNIMEISHLGVRKIKWTLSGLKSRTVFKVIPEEEELPHCSAGLIGNAEVPRRSSSPPTGRYLPNCVNFLPRQQQQQMQHQPSQGCAVQPLDFQEAPDTYTMTTAYLADPHPPAWIESPSGGGAGPRTQAYEDHHLRERHRPTEPPSTGHMIDRPSLATMDLEEEEGRRDSMASDFLFHIPRKASFMARTLSESSSLSPRGSDESELGSLVKGDVPMMPPPGGRRMSMASRAKREAVSDLVI